MIYCSKKRIAEAAATWFANRKFGRAASEQAEVQSQKQQESRHGKIVPSFVCSCSYCCCF